jgi:hypothetical protein
MKFPFKKKIKKKKQKTKQKTKQIETTQTLCIDYI